MERKCPLCRNNVEPLVSSRWELPDMGGHQIGFSICRACGFVLQSPAITPDNISRFYAKLAVYSKNSDPYKPSQEKKEGLKQNINTVLSVNGTIPKSVFQIGCSDGYTLSVFRDAGAEHVIGIDPGEANHEVAQKAFGVKTIIGCIEDYTTDIRYDLLVLTHVLEHLYDPLAVLKKCGRMLADDGLVLLEVPLLEKIELCPTGYFSLEHLNYFSEKTFLKMLSLAGFQAITIKKSYDLTIYPIITVIAKKGSIPTVYDSDYNRSLSLVKKYLQQETRQWQQIENSLKSQLSENTSCYIWGAGIHTTQLFANTDLEQYLSIEGLLDSSQTKWGAKIGKLKCFNPAEVQLQNKKTIIISSYASEKQIYRQLRKQYPEPVKIVTLYS